MLPPTLCIFLKPRKFHQKCKQFLCLIALNKPEIELHVTAVLQLHDHYVIAQMRQKT